MIKPALVALLAGGVLAVAPATSGMAAVAAKSPPNPCKTFTARSADRLFGLSTSTHLVGVLRVFKRPYVVKFCTVRHGRKKLTVETVLRRQAFGNVVCYRRPALGSFGRVCISRQRGVKLTYAVFHKDGVYVASGINENLPHHGAAIYRFALVQYRHFRG